MPNEEEILKILWANIIGDTKEQIESLSWEGAATFILDQTGQLVITSFVPAGFVVAPVFSLFVNTVGRVLDKTYEDWGEMKIHVDKSGVAILEKPVLKTVPGKRKKLPQRIELPVAELIKPNGRLRLNPDAGAQRSRLGQLRPGNQRSEVRHRQLVRNIRGQSETRQEPFPRRDQFRNIMRDSPRTKEQQPPSRHDRLLGNIRGLRGKQQKPSARRELSASSFRRGNSARPQSTIKNDILYPVWALTGTPPRPGESIKLTSLSEIERLRRANQVPDINNKKRDAFKAETHKRNTENAERTRKLGQQLITKSRDHADRVRKQQHEQMERQRRNQQNLWRHKK